MRLLTSILALIMGVILAAASIVTIVTSSAGEVRVSAMMMLAVAIPVLLFSIVRLACGSTIERLSKGDSPDKTITFSRSDPERLALIVGAVSIAVAAYLLIQLRPDSPKAEIAGSATIVIAIAAAVSFALRKPFELTLSPTGLDYTLLKIGLIAWSDIIGVGGKRLYRSDMIELAIRNHTRYFTPGRSRIKLTLRRDPVGNAVAIVAIMPQTLGAPIKPILAAIELRRAAFSKSAVSLNPALERQE